MEGASTNEQMQSFIANGAGQTRDESKLGLTQRAIIDLFRQIKRAKESHGKHVNVFCSFL